MSCHLTTSRQESGRPELNRRPPGPEPGALPTALRPEASRGRTQHGPAAPKDCLAWI